MPSIVTIHFIQPDTSGTMAKKIDYYADAAKNQFAAADVYGPRLIKFVREALTGPHRCFITHEKADQVMGSGTFTIAAQPLEGDIVAIGGVGLTGSSGSIPAASATVKFGIVPGFNNLTANNLATVINSQTGNTASIVFAAVSGNVVTIYSTMASPYDAQITLSSSAQTRISSGSATLSSGAFGTVADYRCGWVGNPSSGQAGSTS